MSGRRAMSHPYHPDEVYFGHALYCTSASFEIEQIRRFLHASSDEVIIMHVLHSYNVSDHLWSNFQGNRYLSLISYQWFWLRDRMSQVVWFGDMIW